MAKKQKHHEEHIDETWLIPYADLLTLLLALFIVLFASSNIDAMKFERLAYSLSTAFTSGTGFMEFPSAIDLDPRSSDDQDQAEDPKDGEQREGEGGAEEDSESELREQEVTDLQELQERINQYIEDNNLSLSLQTILTDQGLMITILDNALFDSGSAQIKSESQSLAREIAQLLYTDPPRHVQISGHTDNVPINNAQFRSNWDLSAMRAINFMKILLDNPDLDPELISSIAYSEFRPVETNDTPEGRAKNRRVEVLILPNYRISVPR
jgi:chemotaxis protein MotB